MQILAGNSLINYTLSGGRLGAAAHPLIVFLHGWGRNGDDFDDLKNRLALFYPTYTFLQIDLPGFGASPPHDAAGLALKDYCTILRHLLHKLNAGPITIVGHSLGGRIAIKFATLFPDKVEKLVLIAAAGIPGRTIKDILLNMGRRLFNTIFVAFGDLKFILRLKNILGAYFGSADYQTSHGALRETLKKVLSEDLRPDAAKIHIPTLILWGENDQITPLQDAKTYHALIKGSRLEILNTGHFVFLESPDECVEILKSFINVTAIDREMQ